MELRDILRNLPEQNDPNLLVGHTGSDDAGVYKIDDERALVLTVDFFTPVVDDPYDFGRVAAANSLSDVYAMGGKAIAAMNIAAFREDLGSEVISEIFRGGAEVAGKAGIVIVGGHTVKDSEVKYGLSVVGIVHPDRIVQNAGAVAGDLLILTKPIGTGALSTALKAEALDAANYAPLVASMTQLNREASERMLEHGVHACTDITGNGLLGHALEMAEASGVTIEIEAETVPVLPGALEMIEKKYVPGGTLTNRALVEGHVSWDRDRDNVIDELLVDPQTSGGLLISVPEAAAANLLEDLRAGHAEAAIIGRVHAKKSVSIKIS